MATFSIAFLGCKVSHVDAHAVRERLLADGHAEQDGRADVAVVNTCCVTHEALSKSRKQAARAARTHRRVYVTGCGANLAADAFAGLPENVVVVARRSEETPDFVAGDVGAIGCVQADARLDRDRAAGYDLPRLVREAGATPGLQRLRLSSIEINHVNDALIAALRDTATVSRHLHVPLQSGDDGVLRAMGRRYTVATYFRRLAPLREEFNLTSDVIVGFPAEDDRAFANTLRTVREAGLTKIHAFPYSPRPG